MSSLYIVPVADAGPPLYTQVGTSALSRVGGARPPVLRTDAEPGAPARRETRDANGHLWHDARLPALDSLQSVVRRLSPWQHFRALRSRLPLEHTCAPT